MGERAVKHVRKFLGQRLRALRKQRGLSQERLGDRAGLSGKFIGEVERGEKSISIDSLYHVSVALEIPLRELTDVRADKPSAVRRVVVPTAFWWLSLTGSVLLLIYSLRQQDSVFIFAYAFTWIPYIRNLIIHHRHVEAHLDCESCGQSCAPHSNFCAACGAPLTGSPTTTAR